MKKTVLIGSYLPALVAALGIASMGMSTCKKQEEEAPPPAPSAAAPLPAPTPVAVAPEEPAAPEPQDAAPDVKKIVKSAPADVAGLRACCTTLQQNAASMPPPNNAYAQQAASLCQSFVAALAAGSSTKAGALGSINSVLKGANLPPACR
jgi:adenosylmethionine-8-amino-7-oxononanoate aminotransferase